MTTRVGLALIGVLLCLAAACGRKSVAGSRLSPSSSPRAGKKEVEGKDTVLPAPTTKGTISLEEAMLRRRSVRRFLPKDLKPEQIGQLLWSAQGITDLDRGFRTAPSAGALYPMTVYVVKEDGVFAYQPAGHKLLQLATDDRRAKLCDAALGQPSVANAGADIVIAGAPSRLRSKYGTRSERYLQLEGGHIAQNVLLQAVSLGLGAVPVGAFNDSGVGTVVGLPSEEDPVYIIPVGYPDTR